MINKLVVENLKHRWVRTLLSAIVIGVQVTLLLTVVGLSEGLMADSAKRALGVGAEILLRPEGAATFTLSSAQIPEKFTSLVLHQPHVRATMGVLIVPIFGITAMAGVDFQEFLDVTGGLKYLEGGPLSGPDDILVDEYYHREHKTKIGSTVKLLNHDWRVAGVIQEGRLSHLIAAKSRLQDLTSNNGRVNQIWVKLDEPANTNLVVEQLNQLLKGNLHAVSVEEFVSVYNVNNLPQLKTFINVVIGLSIAVGFLVVFLSMYTAVLERTREIGVMKALGATPLTILDILIRETIVLAVIGSVVGILLSYAAKSVIMSIIPASIQIVSVPAWWPTAAAIALIGALLGAIYPGLKAARQDAIEALAYD